MFAFPILTVHAVAASQKGGTLHHAEDERQGPLRLDRKAWVAPELNMAEAGKAEAGPNPNVDEGSIGAGGPFQS